MFINDSSFHYGYSTYCLKYDGNQTIYHSAHALQQIENWLTLDFRK